MSGKTTEFVRRQINRLFGFDIVRVSGQHTLRTHVPAVIRQYGIDAVIDIGANEGHFGETLRELGFKGEIYSFEPVVSAFNQLKNAARGDPRWSTFNFALGSESCETEMNVSKFSQFSSLLEANDFGHKWANMAVVQRQRIEVRTLSQCFAEGTLPRERRFLLKMDTQGYDLEVFRGLGGSYGSIHCMLSEISLIPIYENMPHYLEALHEYESAGFLISGMYPITRNANLTLNEMDCMLINSHRSSPPA